MTRAQKDELVDLLLGCRTCKDGSLRGELFERLPSELLERLPANDSAALRQWLSRVVDVCADYERGIASLRDAVHYCEGDSIAMKEVDRFLRELDRPPVAAGERRGRKARLSRIKLLLDRSQQWGPFKELCATSDDSMLVLVHGDAGQDVNLFCERVQRHLNKECPRVHRVCRLKLRDEHSTATIPEDWEERLCEAVQFSGLPATRALSQATEAQALVLILGERPFAGLDAAETAALTLFLEKSLPEILAGARPRHPVRVLVPIEHGVGRGRKDKLVKAVYGAMLEAQGFKSQPLMQLDFPDWNEIEHHLLEHIGELDEEFLDKCEAVHTAFCNERADKRSFAALADAINKLLEEREQERERDAAGAPRPAR